MRSVKLIWAVINKFFLHMTESFSNSSKVWGFYSNTWREKKSNQQKQFTYYVFLMHSSNISPNMWLLSSSPGKHPLFSNTSVCVWIILSFIQNGVGQETVSEPGTSCCTTFIAASICCYSAPTPSSSCSTSMFICLLLACCVISPESLPF